ncbi:prepilin-type N-terminal cleavage/methylation domain-containing protein [Metabacillus litoralis]|uniref:Prepilin-type N-terminal cleavage/methylation domain-containing protein n=1 Tax=Metabacillus litoralis TaxID=152268 RepID=A0A5C6W2Q3_9BACI|nr:prepilin-type N-terminal cleavage/methylation domain-containing protein [Metabacillus litoralis]TXC90110.1 prepilin-type N-terminal cleavage/methylation domain-containing protein [Metabacillus litoralis]
MKSFVKKFHNENGITLIEVMATIVISSIILVVVYNVFMMGIKTYEKVGIEMQLRDEADHIVSSILQTLYETPIDSVEDCGNNCLKISQDQSFVVDQDFPSLIREETADKSLKEEHKVTLSANSVELLSTVGEADPIARNLLTNDYSLIFEQNSEGEEIASRINLLQCINEDGEPGCERGLIEVVLELQHNNFTEDQVISVKPIKLESKFGF